MYDVSYPWGMKEDVSHKEAMQALVRQKENETISMVSSSVIGKWDPGERLKSKSDV